MTTKELATLLKCTPRHIQTSTKKANMAGKNVVTVKKVSFLFSQSQSGEYSFQELKTTKRKTTSKEISFAHLAELTEFNPVATKYTKEDKLLIINFIKKYDYTLKIIVESLLRRAGVFRDAKKSDSLTKKFQRWRKQFEKEGAKALDDKRGSTRERFREIDIEILKESILSAGARGIRENYYGVWDSYCYLYQAQNNKEGNFSAKNESIISYSGVTKAIHRLFEMESHLKDYWHGGEDALLQSYPVGIKNIIYPNQEWQVDATKFDFMCRFVGKDGQPKVGRLNLTAVIDVYTGNTVATLSETITSYDQIRVIQKAFTRMGKPEQIYTDNGRDYVSYHYGEVLLDLGITQINAQVGQGRQKGKIERFFNTLQTELAKLPGYIGNDVESRTKIENQTASKIDQRTGKATRIPTERLLTVEELQIIVDNVTAKRANNYTEQVENLLTEAELEDIRRKLGKQAQRPLHNDGIKYNGNTYTSAALWTGGLAKGNKVEVYEDIDNTNLIYVYHEGRYIGIAKNRNLGEEAMTIEEHKEAKKADRKNNIAPLQKLVKKAKESRKRYEDHNVKKYLEQTPEYAKPKPKEEKKEPSKEPSRYEKLMMELEENDRAS